MHGGRSDNLNVHGAWLHLLTDALGSVAALVAGGLIWACGWNWADPVASILIGLLVIYSSWDLLKEAIAILMESTPASTRRRRRARRCWPPGPACAAFTICTSGRSPAAWSRCRPT